MNVFFFWINEQGSPPHCPPSPPASFLPPFFFSFGRWRMSGLVWNGKFCRAGFVSAPDPHNILRSSLHSFLPFALPPGEKELITAPLCRGDVLPGVTRRSILELAGKWREFKVTERAVGMKEVVKAKKEGRVRQEGEREGGREGRRKEGAEIPGRLWRDKCSWYQRCSTSYHRLGARSSFRLRDSARGFRLCLRVLLGSSSGPAALLVLTGSRTNPVFKSFLPHSLPPFSFLRRTLALGGLRSRDSRSSLSHSRHFVRRGGRGRHQRRRRRGTVDKADVGCAHRHSGAALLPPFLQLFFP